MIRRVWEWRATTSVLLTVSWFLLFWGLTFGPLVPFEIVALGLYVIAMLSSIGDQGRAFRRGMRVEHELFESMGTHLARQIMQDAANGEFDRQGSTLRVDVGEAAPDAPPGLYL